MYAGNESPNCCSGLHGHLYGAIATYVDGYEGESDATRASKHCNIDEPDFIARYQGKAEVYKRVDYLGTANCIAMADMVIFIVL